MMIRRLGIGSILLVSVLYFLIFCAAQLQTARTASVLMTQPPVVVIDAGHGGEDGGASSASGILESALNLAISRKLELLLALCGMQTYMIRSEDVSVSTEGETIRERKRSDLNNRVEMINSVNKPILVSIHQNHFSESKYYGAQVFFSDNDKSRELAQLTQNILRTNLDASNKREAKKADSVYIMQKTSCTGILVECGFLSNPQEAMLLQKQTYQTKLSCAIGCALAQFIEKGETDVEI